MLTNFDYAARFSADGKNVYFVAEGDRDYRVRLQKVVPANPCCNCYSVAKVFTVTAVGMLCDRGLLSPETPMVEVLGEYLPADADPKWWQVTVEHLLLHRVGFDRGVLDIDAEDASLYPTTDYLKLVFDLPLPHQPGQVHQYTDAAYYILSRVVAKVAGMDLSDFLRPLLMETMGFKELAWSVCPQGFSMGATGLYLRTEDMVKLGILYLNDGVWRGQRVLSREWVERVFACGYELKPIKEGWFGKGGMRGQGLILNRAQGIAVACHSFDGEMKKELLIPTDGTK